MFKNKALFMYLAVFIVIFYIFPLVINNTALAMLTLLFLTPVCCFVTALRYGLKYSFDLGLVIGAAVLFVPTLFIFYNSTAWVYTIIYALIVFAGNALGMVIKLFLN